jgi:hypothetical protein
MRRALLFFLPAFAPVWAQTPLPSDAAVHASPNGAVVGTLKRGALVRTGSTKAGWTSVVVEGWIVSSRLSARRDTLDRAVTGSGLVPLRVADGTQQALQAELEPGTALKRLAERNGWTQVRRAVWMRSPAPQRGARGSAKEPATVRPARPDATPPGTAVDVRAQRAMRTTLLRSGPGGDERATIRAGTVVETIAREGAWARVRIEGWVPDRDLMLADSAADARLSAADLRSDPAAYHGRIVRWDVQVIAVQRADPLRRSLAPDEPYLLARGPGDEGAILYVAIPQALLEQVRALPQLSAVMITARVREGRSAPVGAPLLDLISFTRLP